MTRMSRIPALSLFLLLPLFSAFPVRSEILYVDGRYGSDAAPGSPDRPLRSLQRAAELVNVSREPGPTTLIVAPGVYTLSKTIRIENDRRYTTSDRFTITASILPDDPRWKPELMPVLISTGVPDAWPDPGSIVEHSGIKLEIEHVTIQGLKFLGSPVPEIWYYPIFREGNTLDDLLVTQCVFATENYAVTSNVSILANGHGLVVDHCVFIDCRNPVVFWLAEGGVSRGNAMRYCIVKDARTSACWVCDTHSDFEFHHNIIDGAEFVWMRSIGNEYRYSLSDCILGGYRHYSGRVMGPGFRLGPSGPEAAYAESRVLHGGDIRLEGGPGIDSGVPVNLFHPVPGSDGHELGAGLFRSSLRHERYGDERVLVRTIAYKSIGEHPILADVFAPQSDVPAPSVLFIHGGGMVFGSRKYLWTPLKDALLREGIGIVSIDFRLAPETKLEAILEDTRDALSWLRFEGGDLFGLDPDRIALIGGSSGAYQALWTACTADPKPRGVVTVSGLGDLDLLMPGLNPDRSGMDRGSSLFSVLGAGPVSESDDTKRLELAGYLAENGWLLLEILGFDPLQEPERWKQLHLSSILPDDFPPTLIIHSDSDENVPVSEAHKIQAALDRGEIHSKLLVVPGGHSSGLIENHPVAVETILGFLREHLRQETARGGE